MFDAGFTWRVRYIFLDIASRQAHQVSCVLHVCMHTHAMLRVVTDQATRQ